MTVGSKGQLVSAPVRSGVKSAPRAPECEMDGNNTTTQHTVAIIPTPADDTRVRSPRSFLKLLDIQNLTTGLSFTS